MEKRKANKFGYEADILVVLNKVLEQNPNIVSSGIELFREIYYPIAQLEMEMDEVTFENFELVPYTVLNFISLGITEPKDIKNLMGISVGYIQRTIDILMGYGYLKETGLTHRGREALNDGHKISEHTVKQRFKADALTGDLLLVGQQPRDNIMRDKEETSRNTVHMPHIEGVTVQSLNEQLMRKDLTEYKKYSGSILNSNVKAITNIQCLGIDYVKAYLVKMKGIEIPFIITSQYDSTKVTYQERFTWQPIRVPSEKAYQLYQYSEEIPCYDEEATSIIMDTYGMICKEVSRYMKVDLEKVLQEIYPLDMNYVDIQMGNLKSGRPEQIAVRVTSEAFTKWNMFVVKFLLNFDEYQGSVYTHKKLDGLFVRIETQDVIIIELSKKLQRITEILEMKKVIGFIKDKIKDMSEDELNTFTFEKLDGVLAELVSNKETIINNMGEE